MDRGLCSFCSEQASYNCMCQDPPILVCSAHLVSHLEMQADHKMTMCVDNGKTISNDSRNLAIEKLSSLEREVELKSRELTQKFQEIVKSINEQYLNAISRLDRLQTYYRALRYYLMKNPKIITKEFHPPFEAALLEERVEEFFSSVSHPSVKIRNYNKLIVYNDSNFFHIERNYCNNSLFISDDSTINIYPANIAIKSNISSDSSCLQISSKSFLLTGGIKQMRKCFILELPSTLLEHSTLLTPRSYHSMCWINGSPAVIGGKLNNETLNTVEIFGNKKWTEFPPLIHKRFFPSCITHDNKVWVLGGCDDLKVLDSIEYFMDSAWNECQIKLPEQIFNFFLYSCVSGIKIIGGVNWRGESSKSRYSFEDGVGIVFEDKIQENIASTLQGWSAMTKGWGGYNMVGEIIGFKF